MNNDEKKDNKQPYIYEVNTNKPKQAYVFNASSGQGLVDEIDNSYQSRQVVNPPTNNTPVQTPQPVNTVQQVPPVNAVPNQNDQVSAQQQKLLQELYAESEEPQKGKQSGSFSGYGTIALILSLIPVVVFLFCLITSGGSSDEGGEGAVWWLLLIYYWSLGIPLLITSIVLAIIGLKKDIIKTPAKVSLFLDAAPALLIILNILF